MASDADSRTGGVINTDAEFGAVSGIGSSDGIVRSACIGSNAGI
jgi:hypothetical protein